VIEQAAVIRWEDPPPAKAGPPSTGDFTRSRYDRVAEVLRANPGRWALIYDGSLKGRQGAAHQIRQGALRAFTPAGDFDATTRWQGDRLRIYARYLGGDES
jgi:hypothetical protein